MALSPYIETAGWEPLGNLSGIWNDANEIEYRNHSPPEETHPVPLYVPAIPDNSVYDRCETTCAETRVKKPSQYLSSGRLKSLIHRCYCASQGQSWYYRPVYDSQLVIAHPAIVDERYHCAVHEYQYSQVIKLDGDSMYSWWVIHDGVISTYLPFLAGECTGKFMWESLYTYIADRRKHVATPRK